MKKSSNPFSGRNCSGYRFRFQVSSIAHNTLFLPLEMKSLPEIKQLMQGVSPLTVFNCSSSDTARQIFRNIRLQFDFDYWAVNEYFVRDLNDADKIVPLRLNDAQFLVIDTFRKRYFDRLQSRYIISKSFRRCGLSTCIQAFILWLQLYHHSHHSIICAQSPDMMDTLKTSVARNLHREGGKNIVFVTNTASAFFQSVYEPHYLDRCRSSFVHLADMSKWNVNFGEDFDHIYFNALCGWSETPASLFILEGDYPSPTSYTNPFFLNKLMLSSDPNVASEFFHINLDIII